MYHAHWSVLFLWLPLPIAHPPVFSARPLILSASRFLVPDFPLLVLGPSTSNELHLPLRQKPSLDSFQSNLKTFLFPKLWPAKFSVPSFFPLFYVTPYDIPLTLCFCFAKTRFETRAKGEPQKATFTNSCETKPSTMTNRGHGNSCM